MKLSQHDLLQDSTQLTITLVKIHIMIKKLHHDVKNVTRQISGLVTNLKHNKSKFIEKK